MSYKVQTSGCGGLAERDERNKSIIEHAVEAMQLEPIDFTSAVQVRDRINLYFRRCGERGIKPSPVGMLNYLQVPSSVIRSIRNGRPIETADPKITSMLDAAMACLEQITNDAMMNDGGNPIANIFQSKAWFGYSDAPQKNDSVARKEIDKDDLLREAAMLPSPKEIEQE